ncbi:MAG TPA: IPT/TIG domain-containing protein [Acidimicrobiales bacterium]|nr:IPT/TIG domain-containing protein [Acidimicrobiales bacterium]
MFRKLALGAAVIVLPVGIVLAAAPGVASAAAAAPVVKHVAPRHGSALGGTAVAITGTALNGATGVDFGSTPARTFRVVSHHIIIAKSPAVPAGTGTVDITVTTPSGTSAMSTKDRFTYQVLLPVVSHVDPNHGRPAGGTTVTILGKDLNGVTAVDFGTTPATNVTVFSNTIITAKAPAGAGTVDVTVTTPLGTSLVTPKDQFTYRSPLPAVTHVTPHRGSTAGGTAVTIRGYNLTGATTVAFGANAATDVTVITSHLITATSPPGVAGTVDVIVTATAGTSVPTTGDQFTYTNVAPVVTHVAPRHGPAAGGTVVAITGHNLMGTTEVDFGPNPATNVRVISGKIVLAKAPAGIIGTVDITVSTPLGTSSSVPKDQFTYK